MTHVTCPYCQQRARFVDGEELYPHRPDLYGKLFYRCTPCQAWVGCHPGTDKPLGRLANAELRRAKSAAHAAFDPLWKQGNLTRAQAYAWLGKQMGLTLEQTHIGMFDVEQAVRVVELCRTEPKKAPAPKDRSGQQFQPRRTEPTDFSLQVRSDDIMPWD